MNSSNKRKDATAPSVQSVLCLSCDGRNPTLPIPGSARVGIYEHVTHPANTDEPMVNLASGEQHDLMVFAPSRDNSDWQLSEKVMATPHRIGQSLLRAMDAEAQNSLVVIAAQTLTPDLIVALGAMPDGLVGLFVEAPSAAAAEVQSQLEAGLIQWQLDRTEPQPKQAGVTRFHLALRPGGKRPKPEPKPSEQAAAPVVQPPAVHELFKITSAEFDESDIRGTVEGDATGPLPNVVAFTDDQPVALAPVQRDTNGLSFSLELPRALLFDGGADTVHLQLEASAKQDDAFSLNLPPRRLLSAERLLSFDRPDVAPAASRRKPLGIVLYSYTRTDSALLVLESLKRQGKLDLVEIWMDGDQGKPATKKALEEAEAMFREFGVQRITRHRGNLGFRKLILQSLMYMTETYDRFIVLEDDCFPNRIAVEEFCKALDKHADDDSVLTTYGHHFLIPSEQPFCPRFQGWGWATWSDRFKPFLAELAYLFSLRETTFTEWTKSVMTPEVMARLDCTEPRGASITLQRFFAWDETLALLAALSEMKHAPTEKRCVYNFGVGEDSTHFTNIDWYRKPPFNMILKSEVWDHY